MTTLAEQARAELARRQGGTGLAQQARDELARRQPQNGLTTLATTPDGGRVYQDANGNQGFTSPGYSTTDPAKIAEIMQGATPADVVQNDFDQQRLNANPIAARANEVVRGIPFAGSYADELGDLVNPGAGANMRAMTGAMERQNPGQTTALNVTGAIAGAIPMAMAAGPSIAAAAPSTIGGQAIAGAGAGLVAGGLEGAIYGAGEGQGQERVSNAKTGALIGAGGGAVLGAAAPYAAAGIRTVLQRLSGSDVSVIRRELGVSENAAIQIRDTLAAGDMNAAIAAVDQAGDAAMLADTGRPAQQLLDAAAATGGNASTVAQNAVQERTQQASGEMVVALDNAFGPAQGEREIIDSIRAGTAPARSQAYDAAYSQSINYAEGAGRRLETLMGQVPAEAIRKAQRIMDLRGEPSSQIMAQIADDGSVTFTKMPDVRQTHYIMQALDDMAKGTDGTGTFGRQNTMGASIEGLRKQISDSLKQSVPEFANAQNIAADTARQIEMTETGYDLLRTGTRREDVARAMQGASDAEKQAAMQGVRSYIDDMTANVARTITDPDTTTREGLRTMRDFSSRANQTKLRMLLGQDTADTLIGEIDQAATAFELRAAIAENSKTAIRQSIQDGARQVGEGGMVRSLARGEPVNAGKRLVQALTGETAEARQIREMGFYEEVAKALTQVRGNQARNAIRVMNTAMQGQGMSEAQARMIARTITSSAVLSGDRAASTALQ